MLSATAPTFLDRRLALTRRELELRRHLADTTPSTTPSSALESPGKLAAWLTSGREMQAPHLDLIDQAFVDIAAGHVDRVMLTMPPRHGKSRRASRWGPLWYLRRYPDRRVVLASYGAELADEHGRWVRDQIESYNGDDGSPDLGLRLSPSSSAANRWDVAGHDGGMRTVGIGGALTGRGMDLGILDDPVKNAEDAESPTMRRRAWEWWQSTFLTRQEPGGATILILTRWHEDDVAGRLLADIDEAGLWRVINLPALADLNDPLGREPGAALWPDRYPVEALAKIRARVGSRVWFSLFQQKPTPPEGAVWKRAWIRHLPADQLPALGMTVVSIDPAVTSAEGSDDTGIVVAGRGEGTRADEVFVLADRTCHEPPGTWGRIACLAAIEHAAAAFVVEDNQGGEVWELVLRTAWAELVREDKTGDRMMPAVKRVRSRVNKRVRAEPVAALYEQGGRVWHVGTANTLAELEHQLCSWTGGTDSPDRLDALVFGVAHLSNMSGFDAFMNQVLAETPEKPAGPAPVATGIDSFMAALTKG